METEEKPPMEKKKLPKWWKNLSRNERYQVLQIFIGVATAIIAIIAIIVQSQNP